MIELVYRKWDQTQFRLAWNQSENGIYNLIWVDLTRIRSRFLCVCMMKYSSKYLPLIKQKKWRFQRCIWFMTRYCIEVNQTIFSLPLVGGTFASSLYSTYVLNIMWISLYRTVSFYRTIFFYHPICESPYENNALS